MRYLAWVAVFSLQIGMFVCGMGVDVCHAADTTADSQLSQPLHSDQQPSSGVDQTCAAHAAHLFLNTPPFHQQACSLRLEPLRFFTSITLPEILQRIEQPPKEALINS